MAETEKKTTKASSATPAKKSSAAKSGGSSTSKTKQATSASKVPAKKKDSSRKDSGDGQVKAKVKRKNEFALQFVPYILAVVVIFLGACFIMDAWFIPPGIPRKLFFAIENLLSQLSFTRTISLWALPKSSSCSIRRFAAGFADRSSAITDTLRPKIAEAFLATSS